MAELWSDYTDDVITNLDAELGRKYGMTVRALLSKPAKFADQLNVDVTVSNMKEDVDRIMDDMDADLKDEKMELQNAAAKADSLTLQLGQNISMQAKQNKVPFIKTVLLDRDDAADETIYVDNVDDGVLALVEKLTLASNFVYDYTYQFQTYKIGGWLFDSGKSYMLRAYLPANEAMMLDQSKTEINGLFDAALDILKA